MSGTILLTGGSGQLGCELRRLAWPQGWSLDVPERGELDLADADALYRRVAERPYLAVVNAGAYTAVDAAENEPLGCWRVNALAPAALAAACKQQGIPLVQVSTDYVFDGNREGAWQPGDAIAPLGVYGASKAGGELAVRTSGVRHAIIRTAWVVSAQGNNFVKTMLRLGAERDALRVVADQFGSPTSAADLAAAMAVVVRRFVEQPARPSGTWHAVNSGRASWYDLATLVFDRAALHGRKAPSVEPIATSQYPTPARRPANSELCTGSLKRDFDLELRDWRPAVSEIVDQLMGENQL